MPTRARVQRPPDGHYAQPMPGHGERGDGWVTETTAGGRNVGLLPAQHPRGRCPSRPPPRVRDLRGVPDADRARPCRAGGQRGSGPARLRAQRAPRARPGHPRPGRDDAGDPRPPRHRQGRPGRELDGLRDQLGGGPRGARAGPPPRPGLPGRRRAQPAHGPRPRPAGEGRVPGEYEDVPRRPAGLREVRATERPAPLPPADTLPVAGAPAAAPPSRPLPSWGSATHSCRHPSASAKLPGSLRST